MKLKKIASLMLAGIMAVSMLAGCKSGTPVEEDPSSSETPATGVSATFASYLSGDRVTFADNATYQGYLSDAIKNADLDWQFFNGVTSVRKANGDVYNDIADKFEANVLDYGTQTIDQWSGKKIDTKEDGTYIVLYVVPGALSQNVALKGVADALDSALANDVLVNYSEDNGTRYDYDYTGSVSMQKAEDGSASAWYVLVTVSIDATKVKA